jgi:Flp pilus assembly protein CpaB
LNTKTRGIILAFFGLVLLTASIVAGYIIIQNNISKQNDEPAQENQTKVKVIIVAHDMFLGDLIVEGDVVEKEIPIDLAPRDVITNMTDAIGKFLKTDMVEGEMLFSHNLANPTNVNHDLGYILADDHVLFALSVNDLMTNESIIQRGDIIDVFVTLPETTKIQDEETGEMKDATRNFTFDGMQATEITALVAAVVQKENADQGTTKTDEENTSPPTRAQIKVKGYLLALNPQDALILKHFKDSGAVFDLVIRAPTSTMQFDLTPVTQEYIIELYGLEILP